MVTILQELINNVIDDRRLAAIAAVQGNEPDKMMSATTELQNALCALQELCLLQKSQNAKQDQINKLVDRCAELGKERDEALLLLEKKKEELRQDVECVKQYRNELEKLKTQYAKMVQEKKQRTSSPRSAPGGASVRAPKRANALARICGASIPQA